MDLNVNIDNTLLKLTLESGAVLNLQIPRPIQLSIAYGQYWGGIGGDIHDQADLMLLLSGKAPLQHQHEMSDVNGLPAAIQQALDWAVVGWVL